MGETVIWGIHGGKSGDADTRFPSTGIAIGWADAGDISKVADRDGLKGLAAKTLFTTLLMRWEIIGLAAGRVGITRQLRRCGLRAKRERTWNSSSSYP